MNLFPLPGPEITLPVEKLLVSIEKTFPLPRRHAHALPFDTGELSRLYTSGRTDRSRTCLGKPNLLSAYLRFFLPWNVYRLCKLLPSLSLDLENEDSILDIGCGPMTFALALYISRPDLRKITLNFFCLDRTPSVLEAGKKLFTEFTSQEGPGIPKWKINTLRGEFAGNGFYMAHKGKNVFIPPEKILSGKKPALVSILNVFNEIFQELSPFDKKGLQDLADRNASVLDACTGKTIFAAEPGIPRSGEFISGLRSAVLSRGYRIKSPCLHGESCPFPGGFMNGKKSKWCHFSFDTDGAPLALRKLSSAAGIPKERAVMSFLLANKNAGVSAKFLPNEKTIPVRIISDSFPVGKLYGRYACSAMGAILVTGSREKIEALASGDSINVEISGQKDQKSKALKGKPV